ncbi:condensation domain-containing protein [Rhodococcoides corynebacterioides]|uniref:condensation domain-containing protein n=1 Tax=Rhodococcoides corynebacterioides TaxID=53972 RepID=UPI001C9B82F9|nr:condensation domain-containing protein [Rhodococcus corynebacterioides]MBY6363738.1 peptide synthase [Rhodococcus corynebacterioides]
MRLIGADDLLPRPGTVLLWSVQADPETARVQDAPPSFNQRTHLAGTGPLTWLAVAAEVPGPIRRADLARAVLTLLARHESLRTSFRRTPQGLRRAVHPAEALTLRPRSAGPVASPPRARDVVTAFVSEQCAEPWSTPAVAVAAVDRADRSTVVIGIDHALGDAWSLTVLLDDLVRLYRGAPADPVAVPSFGRHCVREAATVVEPDDPRLGEWLRFLRAHGNAPPSFPGPTGVPAGEVRRAVLRTDTLVGADDAGAAEASCRELGTGPFAGALAALAHAVADERSGDRPRSLSLLFPLHTRTLPSESRAVGWYVTNAPVTVAVSADIRSTTRGAGLALRAALPLGEVPIDTVISALGELRRPRHDVFMASFVDYRRLPGHATHGPLDARHVSAVTDADDVQIWFARTDAGLAVRTRVPDTAVARATVDRLIDRMRAQLSALARPALLPADPAPVQ